ncbi:hypothetical protein BGZ70_007469 [Mortierella alpina]|uniref:Uncharacterized protein n=1 Tax=Mortierella alpina TaxID=64518 RepID=A0A9P6J672_MORAP|nr:hypothetical protein BGZ70_007469 [Mortierella alpina]
MANHLCGSDSVYAPVCCVHEHEGQPLLGHHAHAQPQQPQQQQPPHSEKGDYRVDMNDSTSHHQSLSSDNRRCSRSRRRKLWLSFSFIFLYVVGWAYFHSKTHGETCSGFNAASYDGALNDYCNERAIQWDGVTDLTTKAKHFKLYFGKGNLASHVQVKTGQVSEPTLRIAGKVSPWAEGREADMALMASYGSETEYTRLGLHILIKDDGDRFDASLWFEDRDALDEHGGQRYRACARLEVEVVFPETYTGYDSLTIGGNVVNVEGHGLDSIGFQKLDLGASLDVRQSGQNRATHNPGSLKIRTFTSTGSVKNSIQLADAAQVLLLSADTGTGSINTVVSDTFSGHFAVQSRLGSAKVETARGSMSTISFEKSTPSFKSGTKTLDDRRGDNQSKIELSSGIGFASLKFI